MIIERSARDTLTALELHHGDELRFTLASGEIRRISILHSAAEILSTTLRQAGTEEAGARTVYQFHCELTVDGVPLTIRRVVGTQESFYEPVELGGVRIWLDAVDDIFRFMNETHAPCRPQANCSHALPPHRQVRLALQDASLRICPERVHPWCPLPEGGLRIEQCYRGEDCWMGAYDGASAHGGLDLNHAKGTPLFCPVAVDTQFLYNQTANGWNNNRWRAIRRWANGSDWILQTSHMIRVTVPPYQALTGGQFYAEGAGVWIGAHAHTHFAFAVVDHGERILLDPWILFWQMYRDQAEGTLEPNAASCILPP